jgi:hypothetical protein
MKEEKKKGRPLADIDWDKVDSMCKIQCTGDEVASVLNLSYDTLQRACKREKGMSFADYLPQKALAGKASLRRTQWKTATGGNPTMQIWLGKNMLGQTDKQEIDHNVNEMVGIKLILD